MEAFFGDIVTGLFVPVEQFIDILAVSAFHVRVGDELGHPAQDLSLVVVEGRPARGACLLNLHYHILSILIGTWKSMPVPQMSSIVWALMRICAAGWSSFVMYARADG